MSDSTKFDNLSQYDVSLTHENCTVITFDGVPGFAWYDKNGTLHNEGLRFPHMSIIREATVQLLYNSKTDQHSAGWSRIKSSEAHKYTAEQDGDL